MGKKILTNLGNIVGFATFISTSLPLVCLCSVPHHNCSYDGYEECYKIFYNGKLGVCVAEAIDDMFSFLAVFWFMVAIGSAIVWRKTYYTVSPLVIMALLIGLAIWGASIDPSKWAFVIALLLSFALLTTCFIHDSKKKKETKR